VWREASALLEQPQRLEQEYRQRLTVRSEQETERNTVERQRDKLRQGLARLIDSYTEGYLEKPEFDSRVTRQRQRIAALDEQVRQLADAEALQRELRLLIGRLEDFAAQVEESLETADWLTRREIIRTLVSRVEIDHTQVNVVFRVPPDPFVASPDSLDRGVLQHCRRRAQRGTGENCIPNAYGSLDTIGARAFGRSSASKMYQSDSPRSFAAASKFISRIPSTTERTTRAVCGADTKPITRITLITDGPNDARMSSPP
jgi:HPt (histidine-containing phosphotransfer) domain-containing protein